MAKNGDTQKSTSSKKKQRKYYKRDQDHIKGVKSIKNRGGTVYVLLRYYPRFELYEFLTVSTNFHKLRRIRIRVIQELGLNMLDVDMDKEFPIILTRLANW